MNPRPRHVIILCIDALRFDCLSAAPDKSLLEPYGLDRLVSTPTLDHLVQTRQDPAIKQVVALRSIAFGVVWIEIPVISITGLPAIQPGIVSEEAVHIPQRVDEFFPYIFSGSNTGQQVILRLMFRLFVSKDQVGLRLVGCK